MRTSTGGPQVITYIDKYANTARGTYPETRTLVKHHVNLIPVSEDGLSATFTTLTELNGNTCRVLSKAVWRKA